MVVGRRNAFRRLGVTAIAAAILALGHPQQGRAEIEGCPSVDETGDKIVIASMTALVGEVGTRLSRALLAAFEMHFERAEAELDEEAQIIYCNKRPLLEDTAYGAVVAGLLNDERVLLEVGAQRDGDGPDIRVTYVVIPVRYYAFSGQSSSGAKGYHKAIYQQSQISAGLEKLFKGNAELRLMAALALALRHEKIADGERDPERRRALIHRSRAFYCDAVGSLEAAKPRPNFFGLPKSEWQALSDFAREGARRLFGKAAGDPDYVGGLSVVASERAGAAGDNTACVQPPGPVVTGPQR